MGKIEVRIDLAGTLELAIILSLILAAGNLLKFWELSWWWVFSPLLVIVGVLILTALITYLVIIVKNLAERRL